MPSFDDDLDNCSVNYGHDMTHSMVLAYNKMKAIFSPIRGFMNHVTPSTYQKPSQLVQVQLTNDFPYECDMEAKSAVYSSSKQVQASKPKRRFPNTKNHRWSGWLVHRPKPVHMRRETLDVNHELYSQITKGFLLFSLIGLGKGDYENGRF